MHITWSMPHNKYNGPRVDLIHKSHNAPITYLTMHHLEQICTHLVKLSFALLSLCTDRFMMTSSNGNIFRVTGPLCGEFTGPGEFPTQRPVTRSFDVYLDLRLNKRLCKQSWGWWFETLLCPLWRHSNVTNILQGYITLTGVMIWLLPWGNRKPGVGVTKAPFFNFSVNKHLDPAKIPVKLFAPHSYLTSVTAA